MCKKNTRTTTTSIPRVADGPCHSGGKDPLLYPVWIETSRLGRGLLISARFKAYKYYEYPNRAVDTTIRIHSANWNPAGIHWNKQPGIGASHAGRFFPKGAADGWYDWNVTRPVKDWYDHPTRNRGLVMQAANEETDGSYRKFYSADYSDGKYAPVWN